ncbi:hypothetical protein GPALN_005998 [Globodera pallida]|nr:hypothetical protein GPALN_005998 [Globodera pallida]
MFYLELLHTLFDLLLELFHHLFLVLLLEQFHHLIDVLFELLHHLFLVLLELLHHMFHVLLELLHHLFHVLLELPHHLFHVLFELLHHLFLVLLELHQFAIHVLLELLHTLFDVLLELFHNILYRNRGFFMRNGANADSIERKLLIYALATFLGHALVASLFLIRIIININEQAINLVYYPLVMDTGTVVLSSWLLLWASGTFRQQLIKDFSIIRIRNIRVGTMEGPQNNNHRPVGGTVGHQLQTRFMCIDEKSLTKSLKVVDEESIDEKSIDEKSWNRSIACFFLNGTEMFLLHWGSVGRHPNGV